MILREVFMVNPKSMAVARRILAKKTANRPKLRKEKSEADAQCVSFTPDPQRAGRIPAHESFLK